MNHKQAVKYRKDLFGIREYYWMFPEVLNQIGTPEDRIKAEIFLNERGNEIEYWAGGDCEKICENRGKFDMAVKIPSFSKYTDGYDRKVTFEKYFGRNILKIVDIYPRECNCKHSINSKGVGKVDGTCKHTIAFILFIEKNWDDINEKYLEGIFTLEKIYNRPYLDESYYWANGLEKYIDLFKKLEKDRSFRANFKRDILYNHIWNDRFAGERKPLFFSLDEEIREEYFRKYCKRAERSRKFNI